MKVKNLYEAFKVCGGKTAVARVLKVDRKTLWTWEKKGFPRTEWTGETTYAEQIEVLCKMAGAKVTADQLLGMSL